MAHAGSASALLDGVSAVFRSVSCGRVCTVSMRPGKGVENCLNTRGILAGMAGRAQPDVTGPYETGSVTRAGARDRGCVTEWGTLDLFSRTRATNGHAQEVPQDPSIFPKSIASACGGRQKQRTRSICATTRLLEEGRSQSLRGFPSVLPAFDQTHRPIVLDVSAGIVGCSDTTGYRRDPASNANREHVSAQSRSADRGRQPSGRLTYHR
jgi:hypothetical protein